MAEDRAAGYETYQELRAHASLCLRESPRGWSNTECSVQRGCETIKTHLGKAWNRFLWVDLVRAGCTTAPQHRDAVTPVQPSLRQQGQLGAKGQSLSSWIILLRLWPFCESCSTLSCQIAHVCGAAHESLQMRWGNIPDSSQEQQCLRKLASCRWLTGLFLCDIWKVCFCSVLRKRFP